MAKALSKPVLDVRVTFEIDEQEARALDALAGYGDDSFVKAFYQFLGEAYLKPHEAGLRRFLTEIRKVVSPALGEVDEARRRLNQPVKKEDRP